jgi:C4-dicarboxylate-specific signal transduction histidine kinase
MAGAIVATLAVALPVSYFAIGWQSQNAHLRTEADIYAQQVSALINRNPDMWKYETIRLEGILLNQPGENHLESIRVLDLDGTVVAEQKTSLLWPVMTRTQRLRDSGVVVGTLEASASLHRLVMGTAVLVLVGTVLGLGMFFILRVYPMSALRNALDMLSRERGRAKVTLYSIGDGVISTDSEDRVLLVNRVAQDLTGWSQAEAAGKPIAEVFRREGNILVAREGNRRMIEEGSSPILDENGLSLGTVLVFRDVTEKVRTEEELYKAQKLESLGILAAGIAHEIRNPLSAINISVSSIEHVCGKSEGLEPEAGEKIRIIMEQMRSAALKMASVVQRVMEFSKPVPPRKEMVNLNEVIEETIRLSLSTLRKRDIAVLKELAADLPTCRADPRLIEQVLLNLITNAYQAMEEMAGPKHLEIATAVQGGQIVIRVSDSGPGVPPPIRKKIFDPFFTTRKDGSGIGLSFSHRIVADHGGALRLDTSRWGGAEFRIELPGTREGTPA